jgi:Ca2+-binding RTX toxin-like protein
MLKFKKRGFALSPILLLLTACGGRLQDALSCAGSSLCGTKVDDIISGTTTTDLIIGFAGNDTLTGLDGNDSLKGYEGDDIIDGGPGDDYIDGGEGDDSLTGGSGNDKIIGGSGNDTLDGGLESDELFGSSGADRITFSLNDVIADGGSGSDTLIITDLANSRPVTILIQQDKAYFETTFAPTIKNTLNFENFETALSNDFLITDASDTQSIITGSGADIIQSYGSDILIETGAGSDTIYKHEGNGVIETGSGDDLVELLNTGLTSVSLEDGDDEITIRGQFDIIDGGLGSDTLLISNNWVYPNIIFSLQAGAIYSDFPDLFAAKYRMSVQQVENISYDGELDMTLVGDDLSNTISSGSGDDLLIGEGGDDTISGGIGNDEIKGGAGFDTLSGGEGVDRFTFESANDNADEILDFNYETDTLKFVDATGLMLAGDQADSLISGTVAGLTGGANIITVNHNIIVFTDAISTNDGSTIQATLSSINQGSNAAVADGVIVLAATVTEDVMVWYDAEIASGDAVELATLSGVKITDLENFSSDNFLVA